MIWTAAHAGAGLDLRRHAQETVLEAFDIRSSMPSYQVVQAPGAARIPGGELQWGHHTEAAGPGSCGRLSAFAQRQHPKKKQQDTKMNLNERALDTCPNTRGHGFCSLLWLIPVMLKRSRQHSSDFEVISN